MSTYVLESTGALIDLAYELCCKEGHSPNNIIAWPEPGQYAIIGQPSGCHDPYDDMEEVGGIYLSGHGVGEIDVFGAEPVSFVVAKWNGKML